MTTVLVTRPQKQADATAWLLREAGYKTIISPLLTITPTNTSPPPYESVGAIMVTSGNALDMPVDYSNLTDLPCFCVGASTARLAYARHFTKVFHSHSDGTELAELIARKLPVKHKILHISARDVASAGDTALREKGFPVIAWPVYQADPAETFTPQALESIQNKHINAALFYSTRSAETFIKLLSSNGLNDYAQSIIAIGLSAAVNKPLSSLAWHKLVASSVPSEESMLECLRTHCPAG